MELCPKCGRMTAEKNHYNGGIKCYSRTCDYGNNMSISEIRTWWCERCNRFTIHEFNTGTRRCTACNLVVKG